MQFAISTIKKVILWAIFLFSVIMFSACSEKGSLLEEVRSKILYEREKERLNAPVIKQDGSQIPVKVYDENGNLLLETNSEYYIEHQDEIYHYYKSGKYKQ